MALPGASVCARFNRHRDLITPNAGARRVEDRGDRARRRVRSVHGNGDIAAIELGAGLTASTSLGGVLVSDTSSTWHLVYGAADSALYTAKRAGGNQIVIAKL